MKKVISLILLTAMFLAGLANVDLSAVFAEEQTERFVQSEGMDLGQNIVETSEASVQLANPIGKDYSKYVEDVRGELKKSYSEYEWVQIRSNTTDNVSGTIPLNVQGSDAFTESEVLEAVANTGIASSYGGCGAIAMMGMLEYFARAFGYIEIIANSNDSRLRVKLAEDVLNEVDSYEVWWQGEMNTLIFPGDYVSAFNNLMTKYNIPGKIVAKNVGTALIGGHKDEYMQIIRDSVSKGLPVTMYMGVNTGGGVFAKHYTNIYAYEDWAGYNPETSARLEKSFVEARVNLNGWTEDNYYADSEILNNGMGGIIYYEIEECDVSKTVTAADFSTQFVNDSGQGEYFSEEKQATITSASGYTFSTKRLRCSYIDDRYLVLSADKTNEGEAYLEFVLSNDVRKLEFDMSLWSASENLTDNDSILIQIPTVGRLGNITWKSHVWFDQETLSVLKNSPMHYTVIFPDSISRFRFFVQKVGPESEMNKGRIVLDNLTFSYRSCDTVHKHKYFYNPIGYVGHMGTCSCGNSITAQHYVLSSEIKNNKANCKACGKLIDLGKYEVPIIKNSMNKLPVSANGSYITRDGIFVIDDLDLEAYLAGTLTFYNDAGLAIA